MRKLFFIALCFLATTTFSQTHDYPLVSDLFTGEQEDFFTAWKQVLKDHKESDKEQKLQGDDLLYYKKKVRLEQVKVEESFDYFESKMASIVTIDRTFLNKATNHKKLFRLLKKQKKDKRRYLSDDEINLIKYYYKTRTRFNFCLHEYNIILKNI